MKVELDTTQVSETIARQARHLSSQELARGASAALNRAGRATSTAMNRGIRDRLALKSRLVRERLKTSRARPGSLAYTIRVDRRPIPIAEFGGARQVRQGVKVRIIKGGPRVLLESAFIIDRYGGNVFSRVGPDRGPIRSRMGPSIGSQSERVWPDAQRRGDQVMRDRMEHEITRRVERANR